jgi:ribosomal protein S18 acetylase RimI-like enzyme
VSYIVREISGETGWKDFLSIPYEIYRDDLYWVAPQTSEVRRVLNKEKNPYFRDVVLKVFVCYSGDKPVCRSIMVINRRHWLKWNKKSAFFGYFESLNDISAARYLFKQIETECRASGAEFLEGPFNPNHYSELGILTDNYNSSPVFFETYNPPYYPGLLAGAGFSESSVFHTRINTNIQATLSKYGTAAESDIYGRDFRFRKFCIWRMKRDLEIMRGINNDAFENNLFFLPLKKEEYRFSARFMFFVTKPELILFAEYKGQPVGVLQCVIDFNRLIKPLKGKMMIWNIPGLFMQRNRTKDLIIYTVGIKKEFQHTRVAAAMIKSAVKILRKYSTVTTTWISNENKSVIHISDLFEMKPYKHFAIYSKHLQSY